MTRLEKLAKKATKKFGGRQVTQEETKQLLEDYLPGIRQQYKGEVMATTIERFLAQVPKFNRDSLNPEFATPYIF